MNSAATVGEEEITVKLLQSQVDSIIQARKGVDTSQMELETGEALTRGQLTFLIANVVIEELSKDAGIKVSATDLELYKEEIYQSIGGEEMLPSVLVNAGIAPETLDKVLRRDLILRKLSAGARDAGSDDAAVNELVQAAVTKKANELKIVINPRYGIWDSNSFKVVAKNPAGDAVTDK
jgi:hypothetical protein